MKTRLLLTAILVLFTLMQVTAQPNEIIKYFDKFWNPISKDSAEFYAVFTPKGQGYNCTALRVKTKKLHAISYQADTLFTKSMGLFRRYYDSGQLEDSSYFDPQTGTLLSTFYYYPTGKLWATYGYDAKKQKSKTQGYDENGKPINNFIYQREAEFKKGTAEWLRYLSSNLKSNTPVKNGAPKGTYKIIIRFMIAPDGTVTGAVAETNLGYGMEEEGIRVIEKSKKWLPAVLLNEPSTAYRRQPLTFVVQEK